MTLDAAPWTRLSFVFNWNVIFQAVGCEFDSRLPLHVVNNLQWIEFHAVTPSNPRHRQFSVDLALKQRVRVRETFHAFVPACSDTADPRTLGSRLVRWAQRSRFRESGAPRLARAALWARWSFAGRSVSLRIGDSCRRDVPSLSHGISSDRRKLGGGRSLAARQPRRTAKVMKP